MRQEPCTRTANWTQRTRKRFASRHSDDFIDSFDSGTILLELDGEEVDVTDVLREAEFSFAVDANGFFGAKPGIYRAVIARGYWGLIAAEDLDPRLHTIHIGQAVPCLAWTSRTN